MVVVIHTVHGLSRYPVDERYFRVRDWPDYYEICTERDVSQKVLKEVFRGVVLADAGATEGWANR